MPSFWQWVPTVSLTLAELPERTSFKNCSDTPNAIASEALGMHAPAARFAPMTCPVDPILCIALPLRSLPSVKSFSSGFEALVPSPTSTFFTSARLLISARQMRCTSSSLASCDAPRRVSPVCITPFV